MIEPSHINVWSKAQWSLDGDNNNHIDHLGEGQSSVCIGEVEVVVDIASIGALQSARSS